MPTLRGNHGRGFLQRRVADGAPLNGGSNSSSDSDSSLNSDSDSDSDSDLTSGSDSDADSASGLDPSKQCGDGGKFGHCKRRRKHSRGSNKSGVGSRTGPTFAQAASAGWTNAEDVHIDDAVSDYVHGLAKKQSFVGTDIGPPVARVVSINLGVPLSPVGMPPEGMGAHATPAFPGPVARQLLQVPTTANLCLASLDAVFTTPSVEMAWGAPAHKPHSRATRSRNQVQLVVVVSALVVRGSGIWITEGPGFVATPPAQGPSGWMVHLDTQVLGLANSGGVPGAPGVLQVVHLVAAGLTSTQARALRTAWGAYHALLHDDLVSKAVNPVGALHWGVFGAAAMRTAVRVVPCGARRLGATAPRPCEPFSRLFVSESDAAAAAAAAVASAMVITVTSSVTGPETAITLQPGAHTDVACTCVSLSALAAATRASGTVLSTTASRGGSSGRLLWAPKTALVVQMTAPVGLPTDVGVASGSGSGFGSGAGSGAGVVSINTSGLTMQLKHCV